MHRLQRSRGDTQQLFFLPNANRKSGSKNAIAALGSEQRFLKPCLREKAKKTAADYFASFDPQ